MLMLFAAILKRLFVAGVAELFSVNLVIVFVATCMPTAMVKMTQGTGSLRMMGEF